MAFADETTDLARARHLLSGSRAGDRPRRRQHALPAAARRARVPARSRRGPGRRARARRGFSCSTIRTIRPARWRRSSCSRRPSRSAGGTAFCSSPTSPTASSPSTAPSRRARCRFPARRTSRSSSTRSRRRSTWRARASDSRSADATSSTRSTRCARTSGYGTPSAIQAGAAYALDHAAELAGAGRRIAIASARDVLVARIPVARLGGAVRRRATMFLWLPVPAGFTAQAVDAST